MTRECPRRSGKGVSDMVREMRVRYELETGNGGKTVHGYVCGQNELDDVIGRIRDIGYRVVGIDERCRGEDERIPAGEGWEPRGGVV